MRTHYFCAIFLLLALLVTAALSGCGGGGGAAADAPPASDLIYTKEAASEHGAWTILIYLDADNDLESAGITNFNQMELVGSSKDVRIVVQIDRRSGYDTSNGDWTDTRRYLITRDTDTSEIASLRLDSPALGELDMANHYTLKDFVDWGVSEFPADHYCLVLWDHGSGWVIRAAEAVPQYKYIISDDTNYGGMNVTDIPLALAESHMDVVAFDACLMQQLEVAYQMKDSADFMVGSPAPEPSPGYNYGAWLRRINATVTPLQMSQIIVSEYAKAYPAPYKGITHSALDLSKIEDVSSAVSAFADVLRTAPSNAAAQLSSARTATLDYSICNSGADRDSLDIIDYATRCSDALGGTAAGELDTLTQAINAAIVAEVHNSDTPSAHGLAIYIPAPNRYDTDYQLLHFAQNTMWNEWLEAQTR